MSHLDSFTVWAYDGCGVIVECTATWDGAHPDRPWRLTPKDPDLEWWVSDLFAPGDWFDEPPPREGP